MSRFKSRPNLTIPPGWERHNGKGCPVHPDSQPKVQFRSGTKTTGSCPASDWIEMAEGSAWEWEGQREQPFDIVAYLPEDDVVRVRRLSLSHPAGEQL